VRSFSVRTIALALVATVGLGACTPTASTPTATPVTPADKPAELRTLQVGILPATDFLGLYVALDKGWFEGQGLKIELKALAQGRFDVSAPTEPFVAVAEQQGASVIARHYAEVSERTQIAYYVATSDWIAKNPASRGGSRWPSIAGISS
jgi:ABC-type nitrate/sulfonate/bicarbonate transport system substrate-binding protein